MKASSKVLAVAVLMVTATTAQGFVTSTFTSSLDSWGGGQAPSLQAAGGNPGGYLSISSGNSGDVEMNQNGVAWTDNIATNHDGTGGALGKVKFSMDFQTSQASTFIAAYTRWYGGSNVYRFNFTPAMTDSTWAHGEIEIDVNWTDTQAQGAGWIFNASPSGSDWSTDLTNGLSFIRMMGQDSTNGGPAWGFDNPTFSVIPEPATIGLLAIGGLMMMRRRRS